MEESRKKIIKLAKIMRIFAILIVIGVAISILTVIGIAIGYLISNDVTKTGELLEYLSSEGSLSIVFGVDLVESVGLEGALIISTILRSLIRGVIIWYAVVFEKILHNIALGGQPFTKENAQKLFIMSLVGLVFIPVNPIVSLVLLLVGQFISSLFRYAAYLNEKSHQTQHIQESMIVSMAEVVENKSGQTGQHVRRVAEYSKVLALQLGYTEEEADVIKMASMMHDIGKLLVPSEILEKPGKLTPEEYIEIKKHTNYGDKLLKDVEGEVLICARKIAYEHHERPDGKGYPRGLKKNNISIEGKIVAVADVYDALTSKRSYKDAWDSKEAYEEILKNSGTQFDKTVVKAFTDAYDKIDEIRVKFADALAVPPTNA